MKKFIKQKTFLGMMTACAVACMIIPGTLSGNSNTNEKSVKDGMLTENLALTACDVKTNQKQILAQEVGMTLSDVSVSVGAANIEIATKEDTMVPVVMTAATATQAADEVTTEAVTEMPVVTEEAVVAQAESEWANKVMAKVEESANIRVTPDAEGELAGRLRKGDAADIVERGAEWTKISSGNVTGYVKNEFLAFDSEAEQLAAAQGKTATIQTETLRVRKEMSEQAEVVDLVSVGNEFKVVNEVDGWVEIQLDSDEKGFVSAQYVKVEFKLGKAISIEEERAAEAAAKAEAEAKARKEAEKQANSKSPEVTQTSAVASTTDDVTLLGALIQMEAGGEGYDCQLAVASVVMNRISSSSYPNTLSGVIYQRGQFPGASNGKLARILSNGVKSSCLSVAQEALNGKRNVHYLHFNIKSAVSTSRLSDYAIIGSECFY